ncbi:MAG: DUF3108 domain-containing protein [Pseudomonadales bacterium]
MQHAWLLALALWLCSAAALGSGVVTPGTQAAAAPSVPSAVQPRVSYQVLVYDATVAGAPAGTATIALLRDDQGYRIIGQAKATGLWDALSPWRSKFRAHGTWHEGTPTPEQFQYNERGRDKRRRVQVSDGTLRVNKNGKQRPDKPALPGVDVLAALFSSDRCEQVLDLHTGRRGYRLFATSEVAGPSHGDSSCTYRVVDEDEDTFETKIQFAQIDGLRFPRRIQISGAIAGVLKLRESKAHSRLCELKVEDFLEYLCSADFRRESGPSPS